MVFHDLHEVYYIEQSVFSYHWTYQNYQSSVANENIGVVLRNAAGKMVGYFVCMEVLDEMHLLKIAARDGSLAAASYLVAYKEDSRKEKGQKKKSAHGKKNRNKGK